MKKNELISQLLRRREFHEKPPVLIDVGASGAIHGTWSDIAPYSICLAFDADEREYPITEKEDSGYKKLFLFHKIVTADDIEDTDFYLTKSPYCSSLLQPDHISLAFWNFQPLFEIEKKCKLKCITLRKALQESGLNYVDWFKTDSQGTDLRLFQSLGNEIIPLIKIAEFEPGFIDAYRQEDKFDALLKWISGKSFFLDSLEVQHVHRTRADIIKKFIPSGMSPDSYSFFAKKSPAWVNALYLNTGLNYAEWDLRDSLLFLVACILREQFGMTYEFAVLMSQRYPEEQALNAIIEFAEKNIRLSFHRPFMRKVKDRLHRLIENYL